MVGQAVGWLVEWLLYANEPRDEEAGLFRAVTSMEHHFGHVLLLSSYMLSNAHVIEALNEI